MNSAPTEQHDHLDATRGIATGALLGIPVWIAFIAAINALAALTQGATP